MLSIACIFVHWLEAGTHPPLGAPQVPGKQENAKISGLALN